MRDSSRIRFTVATALVSGLGLACEGSASPASTTSALFEDSSSTMVPEVSSSSASTGSTSSNSTTVPDTTSTDAPGTSSTTTSSSTAATTTGDASPECDGRHAPESDECGDSESSGQDGVCGDNTLDPGEECDFGPLNNDLGDTYPTCSESCELLIGCGDGVLQPAEEECDHDGPSETCSPMCDWWGRVVFVSSTAHTGDLGGLAGADDICQELAFGAGLAHPGSYRAWLSTDSESIAPWVVATDEGEEFVRTDGWTIAEDLEAFFTGPFAVPINLTEWGEPAEFTSMWTNTSSAGYAISSENDCGDWTKTDVGGHTGENDEVDEGWTDSYANQSCIGYRHLYCVEGLSNANP